MEIKTLVAKAHENAVKHGFWEPPLSFGTAIALIHSELSEALEEERNGNPDVWFACNESDNFICTPQDETECLMYCTGSAKTISYNTPPVISGSDQNLGAKTAPFTYQYTVTDAQAATQTITVTEKLTNGTQTITLRTYTATSGAQNTVDLSSVWLPLLSGTHVLTITATDSAGGSATRKITFSRTVSRIAAARAFNTDALVQKVFVSLYFEHRFRGKCGKHIGAGSNQRRKGPDRLHGRKWRERK